MCAVPGCNYLSLEFRGYKSSLATAAIQGNLVYSGDIWLVCRSLGIILAVTNLGK